MSKKIILFIYIIGSFFIVYATPKLVNQDSIVIGSSKEKYKNNNVNNKEEVLFSKCIDGDTSKFIIKGEEKTVRFLAINAPEIEHEEQNIKEEPYGKEARDFVCNLLSNAKKISLEYDANSDKNDKYGRVLAFVYADEELIEEKLIEKGYAKIAYLYGDYNYIDILTKAQETAKNNKVGVWSDKNIDSKSQVNDEHVVIKIVDDIIDFICEIVKKIFALL